MRTPNLFIVGAPKCGTTSLYAYLRDHPRIYMSPLKEPQHFAGDLRGERRRIRTIEEYLQCFSGARDETIVGEASTAYLASPDAAQKIKAFAPEARIIIMLRNPADKMYSRFNDARFNNREPHKTFEAALAAEEIDGPTMGLGYRGSARYVEQVRRYLEVFGRDKVHIILFEDLKERPAETYEAVLRFLGVPSDGRSDFPVVNRRRSARSMELQEFVRRPPGWLGSIGRAVIPLAMRAGLRRWFSAVNVDSSPPPPLSQDLRRRLTSDFAAEIEELARLIGRDLSRWLSVDG